VRRGVVIVLSLIFLAVSVSIVGMLVIASDERGARIGDPGAANRGAME
jgi:hypothetical protein